MGKYSHMRAQGGGESRERTRDRSREATVGERKIKCRPEEQNQVPSESAESSVEEELGE